MTVTSNEVGKSQVDICYAALRKLIVSCELEPGVRLNERGLIERLGFGRTPVREALLRLDQDRLIDTIPRSGYRVRPLTRKSIDDFFRVWQVLAPLITELAVQDMSSGHREVLERIGKERASIEIGDIIEQARVAGEFFSLLVLATGNELLSYLYNSLGAEMERIFILFFSTPAGREWIGPSTELEAFARVRDPKLASARIAARIVAARTELLRYVDQCSARGEPILPDNH